MFELEGRTAVSNAYRDDFVYEIGRDEWDILGHHAEQGDVASRRTSLSRRFGYLLRGSHLI